MLKPIIFMIIVFNTVPASIAQAQDTRHEAIRAQMDSLKTAHFERAAQMKREMLERQQAFNEGSETSYSENVVVINGNVYSAKDSLEVKVHPGMEVQVKGESNAIKIDSKGNKNTVIISQSGQGNQTSIHNKTQKQPIKENEDFQ